MSHQPAGTLPHSSSRSLPVEAGVDVLLLGEAQHPADHAAVVPGPAGVAHLPPAPIVLHLHGSLRHRHAQLGPRQDGFDPHLLQAQPRCLRGGHGGSRMGHGVEGGDDRTCPSPSPSQWAPGPHSPLPADQGLRPGQGRCAGAAPSTPHRCPRRGGSRSRPSRCGSTRPGRTHCPRTARCPARWGLGGRTRAGGHRWWDPLSTPRKCPPAAPYLPPGRRWHCASR